MFSFAKFLEEIVCFFERNVGVPIISSGTVYLLLAASAVLRQQQSLHQEVLGLHQGGEQDLGQALAAHAVQQAPHARRLRALGAHAGRQLGVEAAVPRQVGHDGRDAAHVLHQRRTVPPEESLLVCGTQ